MNETTPTHSSTAAEHGGRILILEPDLELAEKIRAALQEAAPSAQADFEATLEQAQDLILRAKPDLFVLDADAVPDVGQEFLYDLRTSHPNARAIVLTGTHFATHREQAAGLGAIHFLEKPFPHGDFVDLVQALLSPASTPESEKFQGTLSDLHLADIIQLKCMSGSSAALQFTGPQGEKARVYFESGQVRHATAPGKEGIAAFNEIVNWKGGQISEVSGAGTSPRTIDLDWQILLMEAVRKMDETRGTETAATSASASGGRKVLVIDDSLMLLSFVKEILAEANYQVTTAATAQEGLSSAASDAPDLILLDYILPDMKGDEVCERLGQDPVTAKVPIVYMSGFGTDLQPEQIKSASVIGSLNKPFTSDLLIKTVENYMPKQTSEPAEPEIKPAAEEQFPAAAEPAPIWDQPTPLANEAPAWTEPVWSQPAPEPVAANEPAWPEPTENISTPSEAVPPATETILPASEAVSPAPTEAAETAGIASAAGATSDAWWSAPVSSSSTFPAAQPAAALGGFEAPVAQPVTAAETEEPLPVNGAFFSGDTSFFSLNGALHTIGKEKLTGTLRSFWNKATVDLLAKEGEIILVTTRDPALYCPEAPITLVNVDAEQTEQGRAEQRESGCPLFLTLASQGQILREPAVQLVQHYGQKLFAQLWTAKRVRFVFEQSETLPDYCNDVPGEPDIDHWMLTTLRCIQFQELGSTKEIESGSIPAYTRDGYDRVQKLRLTVAEAQFASQFNGVRSVAQIAKNLRLDFKFARLTLFRFLALEIVECWPPAVADGKQEKRGFFQKLGFGE
ncbi:MAG TPA: response regulator [Chthoniobacterales bacterium]|nr:response regulator [Chthoniobacterales bacterium]